MPTKVFLFKPKIFLCALLRLYAYVYSTKGTKKVYLLAGTFADVAALFLSTIS